MKSLAIFYTIFNNGPIVELNWMIKAIRDSKQEIWIENKYWNLKLILSWKLLIIIILYSSWVKSDRACIPSCKLFYINSTKTTLLTNNAASMIYDGLPILISLPIFLMNMKDITYWIKNIRLR